MTTMGETSNCRRRKRKLSRTQLQPNWSPLDRNLMTRRCRPSLICTYKGYMFCTHISMGMGL